MLFSEVFATMEFPWLITALLGVTTIFIIYWWGKRKYNYWNIRGVPNKPPSIEQFRKKGVTDAVIELYKQFEGERFCGYIQLSTPTLMIRDPELINRVLIKDFTHFEDRSLPLKDKDDLFSLGIANHTGDEWRYVRHKMTPSFTSGKLKNMFGSIKECCNELIDYLKEKDGGEFEARELMLKCVVNIVGDIAFGIKINTLDESDEKGKQFFKMSSSFFKPSLIFLLKMIITMTHPKLKKLLNLKVVDKDVEDFFRKLTKDIIQYRETTITKRNDFLNIMLDMRRREREILSNKDNNHANTNDGNVKDEAETHHFEREDKLLMDQLNNTPKGARDSTKELFTDEFIAAQTLGFISGGSDSTAGVLSFVLYELAINENIQRKVQDEISTVLSTNEFNFEAVKMMSYLEQIIHEIFRIHPIFGMIGRICTRDYKVPGSELILEKGTHVNIPVICLHKDPQYFPDPEVFNPDRFESMEAVPKNVFFPFGGGPRICIAVRLAMLEMKVILALLLKEYSVTLSEKTKLPLTIKKNSFTQQVEGGLWIKFEKNL